MDFPKLSIITPSYNQGQYLEETLRSVLDQRYPNLEYLVIDGGSTDDSVSIIRRYEDRLAYWVSERDRGQVHALNKGFERATGDIIAFVNSDDIYLPGAFNAAIGYFREHPACEWLCGDTVMFGEGHKTELVRAIVPRSAAQILSWAYRAPQPGMFWKRELVKDGFQERWQYDFDHDLYVRLLLAGHVCEHLPVPLAAYRLHATSKTVAEGDHQVREFDEIADHYERQLSGSGRRWCASTRLLRQSYSAGEAGRSWEATRSLMKAFVLYPEGVSRRPFWGCLRMAVKSNFRRAHHQVDA